MKRAILVVVMLYTASTIAPSVHVLLETAEDACGECDAAAANGPVLAAICPGRCTDPAHHHHHPHDRQHCPACQATHLRVSAIPAPISGVTSAPPCAVLSPGSTTHARVAEIDLAVARAPPSVSLIPDEHPSLEQ